METKNLYIISGCNGVGKTTASYTILPEIIECREFVNADEIAKGLSPFQPEKVAFEAGRIMINRINELLRDNNSFAFETTLSTRSYRKKILDAQKEGYAVILLFFWLNDVELAKERRYFKGIYNLFDIYLPIINGALIFDNSYGKHELIAHKMGTHKLEIVDLEKFKMLKGIHDTKG
ncbi:MAG: zeta toxin [Flavobacteriaceae bacterium]|nr:MAG: zeta toxin [Flavobacteriaceae bacterium]